MDCEAAHVGSTVNDDSDDNHDNDEKAPPSDLDTSGEVDQESLTPHTTNMPVMDVPPPLQDMTEQLSRNNMDELDQSASEPETQVTGRRAPAVIWTQDETATMEAAAPVLEVVTAGAAQEPVEEPVFLTARVVSDDEEAEEVDEDLPTSSWLQVGGNNHSRSKTVQTSKPLIEVVASTDFEDLD
jgi:hypothetical protein